MQNVAELAGKYDKANKPALEKFWITKERHPKEYWLEHKLTRS